MRITQPDGIVLFEMIPPAVAGYEWPQLASDGPQASAEMLATLSHPTKPQEILAGCQKL